MQASVSTAHGGEMLRRVCCVYIWAHCTSDIGVCKFILCTSSSSSTWDDGPMTWQRCNAADSLFVQHILFSASTILLIDKCVFRLVAIGHRDRESKSLDSIRIKCCSNWIPCNAVDLPPARKLTFHLSFGHLKVYEPWMWGWSGQSRHPKPDKCFILTSMNVFNSIKSLILNSVMLFWISWHYSKCIDKTYVCLLWERIEKKFFFSLWCVCVCVWGEICIIFLSIDSMDSVGERKINFRFGKI